MSAAMLGSATPPAASAAPGAVARRLPGGFVRLFSGALASQALTSAANFLVGLVLIRTQAEAQYGAYVLVTTTLLLLAGLQFAYLGPSMVIRLTALDHPGRRDLIGRLLRAQRRVVPLAAAGVGTLIALAWLAGRLDGPTAILAGAAVVASVATLFREFFRMVLLAYRRPLDILKADVFYVVLLVGGALLAARAPLPAAAAVATLGFAAAVGGALLARHLWRHEGWSSTGAGGILREFAPLGTWAVFGAGVHWAFSQGYAYIVAGTLDVEAVAAIAATRLLLMPVNLLSQGISQVMLPTAARWLHDHGAARVFSRLALFAGGVAGVALVYCGAMWMMRGWIFGQLMHRQVPHADTLLLLWGAIFLLMALRDQLAHLLVARARLRELSTMTLVSAVLSLTVTYGATVAYGVAGALAGVLAGELLNVLGIIAMSALERHRPAPVPTPG